MKAGVIKGIFRKSMYASEKIYRLISYGNAPLKLFKSLCFICRGEIQEQRHKGCNKGPGEGNKGNGIPYQKKPPDGTAGMWEQRLQKMPLQKIAEKT